MQQCQKKRIVFRTWGAALFESAQFVKEEQSVTKSNLRQAELAETVSS